MYPVVECDHGRCMTTPDDLQFLENMILQADIIGYDSESTGLERDADIVGISLAEGPDYGYYVPAIYVKTDLFAPDVQTVTPEQITRLLDALFRRRTKLVLAHNYKHELTILRHVGILPSTITAPVTDTAIQSWLENPNRKKGLKPRVKEEFNYEMEEIDWEKERAEEIAIDRMVHYASDDARWLIPLYYEQKNACDRINPRLHKTLVEVEMPLIPIIEQMEANGIGVNLDALRLLGLEYRDEQDIIKRKMQELLQLQSKRMNIGSGSWLSSVLIDQLGWWKPIGIRGANGAWPVTADNLEEWACGKPHARKEGAQFAALLLQWRRLDKLIGTYVDPMLKHVKNGKIHANFNQIGTVTGRFSSSNPNLQNIPIRTEEGRKLRGVFVPQQGWDMFDADFSQIELRFTAHFSRDPIMLKAYREGLDIHQMTADAIGCERSHAKTINFGYLV